MEKSASARAPSRPRFSSFYSPFAPHPPPTPPLSLSLSLSVGDAARYPSVSRDNGTASLDALRKFAAPNCVFRGERASEHSRSLARSLARPLAHSLPIIPGHRSAGALSPPARVLRNDFFTRHEARPALPPVLNHLGEPGDAEFHSMNGNR